MGLRIFAMAPDGSGAYGGAIYNTDDGQTYPAKITLRPDEHLEIRGCSGALCGAELWSKLISTGLRGTTASGYAWSSDRSRCWCSSCCSRTS